jgi:hypothetical protein
MTTAQQSDAFLPQEQSALRNQNSGPDDSVSADLKIGADRATVRFVHG